MTEGEKQWITAFLLLSFFTSTNGRRDMEITNLIFGVNIDFAPDDEIKFRFMIQDDGTWHIEVDAFDVIVIPQITNVLKEVQGHLRANRKSLKTFADGGAAAELRDAKSKHNKNAFLIYLFLNSSPIEAIRYGQDWNPILIELMEDAQGYCESLGINFNNPAPQSSDQHQ
jgi:hypothetical protein